MMKEIASYGATRDTHNYRLSYRDSDLGLIYAVIRGLDGEYSGGEYILKIKLPKDYPFSPPVVAFLTPNGRFEPEVSICLNITHMHSETWSPLITLEKLIYSVMSVLYDPTISGIGGMVSSADKKKTLAASSVEYNRKHFTHILQAQK